MISKFEIEIENFLSVQAKSHRLVVALIENFEGAVYGGDSSAE